MRRSSARSKRHGLARRPDRLAARCERLRRALGDDDVRVFFGGRQLAAAGNDTLAQAYESREQWRARFDRARSGDFAPAVVPGGARGPRASCDMLEGAQRFAA